MVKSSSFRWSKDTGYLFENAVINYMILLQNYQLQNQSESYLQVCQTLESQLFSSTSLSNICTSLAQPPILLSLQACKTINSQRSIAKYNIVIFQPVESQNEYYAFAGLNIIYIDTYSNFQAFFLLTTWYLVD